MIRRSFSFLDGIGERTEKSLWSDGIDSWDKFLSCSKDSVPSISGKRKAYYDRRIKEARSNLYSFNSSYFRSIRDTWRLYDFFRDETVFLDIESSGNSEDDYITIFGLFDGVNTKVMVDLDLKALEEELSKYKLIVTFNGSSYDLPLIRKKFDILPEIPHIDLRHLCSRLGLTGGLKEIEKELGIKRPGLVGQLGSGDPLTLWKMYRASGDEYYLDLLVEYNEEDVFNLKKIMEHCYERLSSMPFE
ncbi:MAG: ribonuclease H-like domain-containing protein [Nanobdellota archaeon]